MKTSFILSTSPLGIFTFGIWPLIMSILVIARRDRFQDPDYALIVGLVSLLTVFFPIGFIMGFFLKEHNGEIQLQVIPQTHQ